MSKDTRFALGFRIGPVPFVLNAFDLFRGRFSAVTVSDSAFWISDVSFPSTLSHEKGLSRSSRSDKSL